MIVGKGPVDEQPYAHEQREREPGQRRPQHGRRDQAERGEEQHERPHVPRPHRPQQQHDQRETQRRLNGPVDAAGASQRAIDANETRGNPAATGSETVPIEVGSPDFQVDTFNRAAMTELPCGDLVREALESRGCGQNLGAGRRVLERRRRLDLFGAVGGLHANAHAAVWTAIERREHPEPAALPRAQPVACAPRIICSPATTASSTAGRRFPLLSF